VVGLRDVLLDYAKPPALQRLLLATVGTGLLAIAISVVWILASIPR
jgi:succinate dehydrogenase hydrophobic anchor subunit